MRLRVSAAALRTIEHKGGLDAFLKNTPDRDLSPEIRRLKKPRRFRRREKGGELTCSPSGPAKRPGPVLSLQLAYRSS